MVSNLRPVRRFAICIRNRVAAVALIVGDQVKRLWRRHFAYAGTRTRVEYLAALLVRLHREHEVDEIVVEGDSTAREAATSLGLAIRTVELEDAKAILIDAAGGATTHRRLLEHLLPQHPVLAEDIPRLRSGQVPNAPAGRWQTVPVLAVALGLAIEQQDRQQQHATSNYL